MIKKLTTDQVIAIRYSLDNSTNKELAEKYNVSDSTITRIKQGWGRSFNKISEYDLSELSLESMNLIANTNHNMSGCKACGKFYHFKNGHFC